MLHKQFYDAQSIFVLFSVSFEVSFEAYEDERLLSFPAVFLFSPAHRNEHLLSNHSSNIHQG